MQIQSDIVCVNYMYIHVHVVAMLHSVNYYVLYIVRTFSPKVHVHVHVVAMLHSVNYSIVHVLYIQPKVHVHVHVVTGIFSLGGCTCAV